MFDMIATVAALRRVEQVSFDHYFDTLISNRPGRNDRSAWFANYERDVARARGVGQSKPRRYTSRKGYKKKVSADFAEARKEIRQYLSAGIAELGSNCYSHEAVSNLLERLRLPAPTATPPDRVASVMNVLPIIHDTTRDIGTASSVVSILDADNHETAIPAVMLTSAFNITLTQISRLLVRRAFYAVSERAIAEQSGYGAVATVFGLGSLFMKRDQGGLTSLERDARVLFHLLGIWVVGDPYPTPLIDQSVLDLASMDTDEGERLINMTTLYHKSGWCLFESLHEFSHILMGDWLLPSEQWTPDLEIRADRFAAYCLLLTENELTRVFLLRGACSFLRLLALVEQRHGRTPRHPEAWARAAEVERLVLSSGVLDPYDATLFIRSASLDTLVDYCHDPTTYGVADHEIFGR